MFCSDKSRPTLGSFRQNHKKEVVLLQIRIGHAYFSHSFLPREDEPECVGCQAPYIVRHVLIDCADLIVICDCFYQGHSLKQLFDTVSVANIISFLSGVNFFNKRDSTKSVNVSLCKKNS